MTVHKEIKKKLPPFRVIVFELFLMPGKWVGMIILNFAPQISLWRLFIHVYMYLLIYSLLSPKCSNSFHHKRAAISKKQPESLALRGNRANI